jgi:hypothetical protein
MYRLFTAFLEREMLDGDGGQGALLRNWVFGLLKQAPATSLSFSLLKSSHS